MIEYVVGVELSRLPPDGWAARVFDVVDDGKLDVRANRALIPAAVDEALRFGPPVRGFTRFATTRDETDTVAIPERERVLIPFGAANRDERHYADPDRFGVTRESRDPRRLRPRRPPLRGRPSRATRAG